MLTRAACQVSILLVLCLLCAGCSPSRPSTTQVAQEPPPLLVSEMATEATSTQVQIQRCRDGAEAAVVTTCSKDITGFRRMVGTTVRDYSDKINEWSATATVEYINTVGGVERTNLDLKFTSFSGHITALIDYEKIWDKEMDRIRKDQERRDRETLRATGKN